MPTVDQLLEQIGMSVEELARQARLSAKRVEAIATGRWTPSPAERESIAQALGVAGNDIVWGHTMDPRNVRYRRYGLKENF